MGVTEDPDNHGMIFNSHALTFWKTPEANKSWTVEGLSWPSALGDAFHLDFSNIQSNLHFSFDLTTVSVKQSRNASAAISVGKREGSPPPILANRPVHWKVSYDKSENKILFYIHGKLVRSLAENGQLASGKLNISLASENWAHELLLVRGHLFRN